MKERGSRIQPRGASKLYWGSMNRVFFTYVWGQPGEPAWPLTFAGKAERTHAKKHLSEGDIVFTVGTRGAPTPPIDQGRVLAAYMASGLEVNTRDYVDPSLDEASWIETVTRFPVALHPVAVWGITSANNVFSTLVGSLTPKHHLQGQSRIVELDQVTAEPLLALERRQLPIAVPKTVFGQGLVAKANSKLAPKHQGIFSGAFAPHEIWYVYVLVLKDVRNKELAFKIGYSHDPALRSAAYNIPLAPEVTGLKWSVCLEQPTPSEEAARIVEQTLLSRFKKNRLASNGEIVSGLSSATISSSIADIMRKQETCA